jgi:hypothetical protein
LLEAAKSAEPVNDNRYASRFRQYDDVLKELHAKGFRASHIHKWFVAQGIDFKYAAITGRLKRLGLSPGQTQAEPAK